MDVESGDFVTRSQWRRCVDPTLRERSWTPAHGTAYVGLDLGLTHDRTALAAVYVDGQEVVLDELQVWQGSRGEPVQIEAVERALVDLRRRHGGRLHVTADPWQLKASIQRLQSQGVSIEEFAFAPATGKTPDVQTIVISNAGYSQSGWQWRVRESAGEADWAYLFTVDGVIANWVTDEWIAQMRALLPGSAFDRVIGNRWTSESGDFVTRSQWRRCVDPTLRERSWTPAHGTAYVGLDLGLTHDRTALAAVYVDGQEVVLDELQVWQGSRGEPVQIEAVERALVDLRRRHGGRLHVTADPWQLKASIQRLQSQGVSIEEFAFAPASIQKLSALLYETISGATLRVFDDQELEEEILGLQVVQRPSGWSFDHRAQGYSDRAVALAMATRAAIRRRRPDAPAGVVRERSRDYGAISGDLLTRSF